MFSVKPETTNSGFSLQLKRHRRLATGSFLITILFLVAMFASGCVVHHRGHGPGHGRGAVVVAPHVDVIAPAPTVHVAPAPVTFVFTDHHRHTVRSYYSHHRPHGKKGKWKRKHGRGPGRGHGPPPWARKGGHIPPGIAMQAVPHDLAVQLPSAPHGTQFIYYSDQVLLVDVHSHVVLDSISISVGF